MPIFDYRCQACDHTFDVLQKLGAGPLTDCPECGQTELKKLLSAPAFHLKGKGWRNSDDTPKKPNVRPKFVHTLDSPVPHAEHTHDGAPTSVGHSHGHDHDDHGGGVGRIVREHVHSHGHSHGHGGDKEKKLGDHGHGHKHDH